MMSSLTALVFIGVLSLVAADNKPYFCHDLDCPKYTVVGKKSGYEIRKYEASKWVGTTIASMNFSSATHEGFDMLFDYISGANDAKTKIPMATPVATKIVPGQGPACETNFTVMFFTPFAFDANTPEPTNPKLSIINIPAITAYVTSFGGHEKDEELYEHAAELANQLAVNKVDFVQDFYFTAGYDPPYRVVGRHNEVWMIASD